MDILLIVLLIILLGGGGFYGHRRWRGGGAYKPNVVWRRHREARYYLNVKWFSYRAS